MASDSNYRILDEEGAEGPPQLMRVAALGSGSSGNCHYIESDGTRLLVDCGFGPREANRRLRAIGSSLERIDAILITHEHTDHIRGAESIGRKFEIPVYLTRGTLETSRLDPAELPTVIFENGSSFRVGEIEVHSRRTSHDASDPACFVLEAGDGTRVGIATDLGWVDPTVLQHLSGCDGLLFEANHDVDMLRRGSYPWSLKRRILSRYGHLSNDDSMAALQRLIGGELKALCLIHLSKKNNHESIVASMAGELMERLGVQIALQISRQEEPCAALEFARRPGERLTAAAQLALF